MGDLFSSVERLLSRPYWRGGGERLPHRDFIRDHCWAPSDGLVAEDLDLVLRLFGRGHETDAIGRLCLVEIKYAGRTMGTSKRKTFGILDCALRTSEQTKDRYGGFWLLQCQASEPGTFWEDDDSLIVLSEWESKWSMTLYPKGEPRTLTMDEFAAWVNEG